MNLALILNDWFLTQLGTLADHESHESHASCALPKGWTLRPAAKVLGVNFTHLHRVLRGDRHSASLLRRVAKLPPNPAKP